MFMCLILMAFPLVAIPTLSPILLPWMIFFRLSRLWMMDSFSTISKLKLGRLSNWYLILGKQQFRLKSLTIRGDPSRTPPPSPSLG
jgi:hypothetical protein